MDHRRRYLILSILPALAFSVNVPFAYASEAELSLKARDLARTLFDAGHYDDAIKTLQKYKTVDALILRAEIMSAKVMLSYVDNPHKYAGQAKAAAQDALDLNPDHAEAQIQHALASGFEARTAGVFKAWRKKLPQKCKLSIDAAYAAAPNDPRTSALLGAWHLGLVRKAGARRAAKMFGASEVDGIFWYDKAVAGRSSDIVILGNYAITLLGIDRARHRDKVAKLLNAMHAASAKTEVEKTVKSRMARLSPVWNDHEALGETVTQLMNDPLDED